MTPSISTVISSGFGSFGDVGLVITDGFGTGAAASTSTPSGVSRGKAIRLREIEKREDLGEYLKAQLNLKHGDLVPQAVKAKPKRDKKQDAQVELAMRAMELEQEQERINRSNNDLLILLMMTEV